MRTNRVVVAGGGAAGMMAAITAARFGAEVSGATSESTKDAISLFASRRKFAVSYRGDISLSVTPQW